MQILQDTVKENRPSIKIMTGNLAEMSEELKGFASKLNNSVNQDEVQSTLSNFNQTSTNIVTISKNLDELTNSINSKSTQISNTIDDANKIANNIEIITTGLKNTMSKNFAGFRLLFGKPINKTNCD